MTDTERRGYEHLFTEATRARLADMFDGTSAGLGPVETLFELLDTFAGSIARHYPDGFGMIPPTTETLVADWHRDHNQEGRL